MGLIVCSETFKVSGKCAWSYCAGLDIGPLKGICTVVGFRKQLIEAGSVQSSCDIAKLIYICGS